MYKKTQLTEAPLLPPNVGDDIANLFGFGHT